MKTLKQAAIDLAAKKIKQMGDFEFLGWPPNCFGTYYQPERPLADAQFPDDETHTDLI